MRRFLVGFLATIGAVALLLVAGGVAAAWLLWPGPPGLPDRIILTLDLREEIPEMPQAEPLSALGLQQGPTLIELIMALDQAGHDPRVQGLIARLDDAGPSLAQTQELRAALARFRSQGKFAYAHADSFGEFGPGMLGYYLATAFDEIQLQPLGALGLTGIVIETPLLRELLDRIGIEPLLNFEQTARALRIAMDADGLAFPRRKITLSTSGVAPKIEACGRELGVGLAISLHAVRDELRDQLVPLNRKWNIAALLDACRAYADGSDRAITFEYVMLDGVNDADADARELVRLIRGIPAKVNLIPFNPWPGAPYRRSPPERIAAFGAIVSRAGYPAPVRTPRGSDILAACGQLKTASERRRRVSRAA